MRGLLGLELDPLVILYELHSIAARLGNLHERVGARVAPTAYEGREVHARLAEGLGDAHDALSALLAHVLDGIGDLHALAPLVRCSHTVYPSREGPATCTLCGGVSST